jgi:hypothetical protein
MNTNTTSKPMSIGWHQLQIDVRPGVGGGPPLLLCGDIGANYQAL